MGRSPLPMTPLPSYYPIEWPIKNSSSGAYGVSVAVDSLTGEIKDISLVAIPAEPAKAVPVKTEPDVVAVDLDTIRRFNF